MGVDELAAGVGRFPTTVRAHLERLVEAGMVTRSAAPPSGRGRPPVRYTADREATAAAEDARPYARLAAALAAQLAALPDPAAAAGEAGARWGRAIAAELPPAKGRSRAVASMVAILNSAGFEAEAHPGASGEIRLQGCPFGQLNVGRESVVCSVHLGLMQGAMLGLGAPAAGIDLEPFVEPGLCVARIGFDTAV